MADYRDVLAAGAAQQQAEQQRGMQRRAVNWATDTPAPMDIRSDTEKEWDATRERTKGWAPMLGGLYSQLTGDQAGAQESYASAKRHDERAAQLDSNVSTDYRDIDSVGGAFDYARKLAISSAPDMALSMGLGGAGRGLARRAAANAERRAVVARVSADMAEDGATSPLAQRALEIAEQRTARAATEGVAAKQRAEAVQRAAGEAVARMPSAQARIDRAGRAGGFAGATAGQFPGMTMESREHLEKTDQEGAWKIAAADLAAAGVGALPTERLLGRVLKTPAAKEGLAKQLAMAVPRIAKETGQQALFEGTTEAAQAFVQRAGHKWVDDNVALLSPEAVQDYVANFVGGVVLGGATGGAVETANQTAGVTSSAFREARPLARTGLDKASEGGRWAWDQSGSVRESVRDYLLNKSPFFQRAADAVAGEQWGAAGTLRGKLSGAADALSEAARGASGAAQRFTANMRRQARESDIDAATDAVMDDYNTVFESDVETGAPVHPAVARQPNFTRKWVLSALNPDYLSQLASVDDTAVLLERYVNGQSGQFSPQEYRQLNRLLEDPRSGMTPAKLARLGFEGSKTKGAFRRMAGSAKRMSDGAENLGYGTQPIAAATQADRTVINEDTHEDGADGITLGEVALSNAGPSGAYGADESLAPTDALNSARRTYRDTNEGALQPRHTGNPETQVEGPVNERRSQARDSMAAAQAEARRRLLGESGMRDGKTISNPAVWTLNGGATEQARASNRREYMARRDNDPNFVELTEPVPFKMDRKTDMRPGLLNLPTLITRQQTAMRAEGTMDANISGHAALMRGLSELIQAGIGFDPATLNIGDITYTHKASGKSRVLARLEQVDIDHLQSMAERQRAIGPQPRDMRPDGTAMPPQSTALSPAESEALDREYAAATRHETEGNPEPMDASGQAQHALRAREAPRGVAVPAEGRTEYVSSQSPVADVRVREPHAKTLLAWRRARDDAKARGQDTTELQKRFGQEIGAKEIAREVEAGTMSKARAATELERLKSKDGKLAIKYLTDALHGKLQGGESTVSVTHTANDNEAFAKGEDSDPWLYGVDENGDYRGSVKHLWDKASEVRQAAEKAGQRPDRKAAQAHEARMNPESAREMSSADELQKRAKEHEVQTRAAEKAEESKVGAPAAESKKPKKPKKQVFKVGKGVEKAAPNPEPAKPAPAKPDADLPSEPSTPTLSTTKSDGYRNRTLENVGASDVTIAFAVDHTTAGEQLTARAAGNRLVKWTGGDLKAFAKSIAAKLDAVDGRVLNVAGNGMQTFAKHGYQQWQVNDMLFKVLREVKRLHPKLQEVISGGQTGADIGGVVAAAALGLDTRIHAPKGFRARGADGKDFTMAEEQVLGYVKDEAAAVLAEAKLPAEPVENDHGGRPTPEQRKARRASMEQAAKPTEAAAPKQAEPKAEGVPVMVTQAMKRDLRAKGFTNEQISKMTPAQAHAALKAEKPKAEKQQSTKAEAPKPPVSKRGEAITSAQLKREGEFATAMMRALGFDVTIEVKSNEGRSTGPYAGGAGSYQSVIYLGDKLTGRERMDVLVHEIGHLVVSNAIAKALGVPMSQVVDSKGNYLKGDGWMTALAKADPKLAKALRADYKAWRAKYNQQSTIDSVRTGRSGQARAANTRARNGRTQQVGNISFDHADYLLSMNEWVADNLSRALQRSGAGNTLVEQFFGKIAAQIKRAYERLVKWTGNNPDWRTAPSVEAWVNDLFNQNTNAVRQATGQAATKAQAEAVVEAAVRSEVAPDPTVPLPKAKMQAANAKKKAPKAAEPPSPPAPPAAKKAKPGKPPKDFEGMMQYVRDFLPPQERKILEATFSGVRGKLRNIYAKRPDVLEAMTHAEHGMEATIAAGYLAWKAGKFKVGPKGDSALVSISDILHEIVGLAGTGSYAHRVLKDIASGKVQAMKEHGHTYDIVKAEARARGKLQQAVNKLGDVKEAVMRPVDRAFVGVGQQMRESGIPAMRKIGALLYRHGGATGEDRGMVREITHTTAQFANKAAEALNGLSVGQQRRVIRLLQEQATPEQINAKVSKRVGNKRNANHGNYRYSKEVREATKAIRVMMDEAFKYMEGAGVEVGYRKNFFPVLLDIRNDQARAQLTQLLSDPAYEQDIRGFFEKKSKPKDAGEPKAKMSTEAMIENLVNGAMRGENAAPGPDAPEFHSQNFQLMEFIYRRRNEALASGDAAAIAHHEANVKLFASLQTSSPVEAFARYIEPMVRRTEYVRRFGNKGEKLGAMLADMKKQGATDDQVRHAREAVQAAAGTYGQDLSPTINALSPALAERLSGRKSRAFISGMQAYQNARLLPLSLLSSLVDPMGIAVRSGGDFATAWSGIRGGLRAVFNKASRDELHDMLRLLGSAEDMGSMEALQQGFGGAGNVTAAKVNEFLFKWNGLAAWTRSTRYMALLSAHAFLIKHAEGATKGKTTTMPGQPDAESPRQRSSRYLAELNVKPGDVQLENVTLPGGRERQQVKLLTADERAKLAKSKDAADKEKLAADDRVRRALMQFVDEAILRPNSQQTPQWHSDPYMGLVTQYKAFGYAMYDQIMGRVNVELENQNHKVLLAAGAYVPIVIMAEMLRNVAQGDSDDTDDWGPDDWLKLGAERSGFLSPKFSLVEGAVDDVRHGRGPIASQMGPTASQARDVGKAAFGARDLGNTFESALPGSALYKKWNDEPRRHAE